MATTTTTTTPESRARIAYTAYSRAMHDGGLIPSAWPTFDELPAEQRAGWMKASEVLWDLATTGRATL